MKNYNHIKIEKKWQTIWEKAGIYHADNKSKKPKYYSLIEFPYPSGSGLHVGHIRSNTAMDIISRKRRMEGHNVLYPIGWDAFGLPTENYAIKSGIHPIKVTKDNTNTFRRQLRALGFSFDWSREINTTDPRYYKWTQWIFLQFFKKGLAYKKRTEINWCPSCKIGLANEEVVVGMCERCGGKTEKREKEQWMLAITKYADRLDKDLDTVNYLEKIKIQQRNWIGKSEGAEIEFRLTHSLSPLPDSAEASTGKQGEGGLRMSEIIKVFTTRPDTIFGATYIVLAPEHDLIANLKLKITNWDEVQKYINTVKKKTEIERTTESREKTGIELKGIKAINPATGEEIPVWIADYVLASYGTGAIMAVPAHDERDFEFAKKYNLPIKQVVAPVSKSPIPEQKVREGEPFRNREAVMCIVKHWGKDEYLCQEWKDFSGVRTLISGGIEPDEDVVTAGKREILEESGFLNAKFIRQLGGFSYVEFYHQRKQTNMRARFRYLYFELENGQREKISDKENNQHQFIWKKQNEVVDFLNISEKERIWELFINGKKEIFTDVGYLVNSDKFDGLDSKKAKKEIVKFIGAKEKTTFKLRDWVFSRQRYWGEPIPLVFCENCRRRTSLETSDVYNAGWVPVPDKDLPVLLPKVKTYKPRDDGESPLAGMKSWVNVKCPKCKGPARRETDTMPNWAGSSWYFLRYTDPKNKKEFASRKNLEYWTPVDWYNGGMEHTTLHLLYSRFWHKFLYDLKLVPTIEPYAKRTSHGMILADDGTKFSKSKGNGVDPDDLVKTYGADTVRLYEMFMGPFDQAVSWSTDSMVGPRRFLERVWHMSRTVLDKPHLSLLLKGEEKGNPFPFQGKAGDEVERLLHKTIKKVSEDIEAMRFNTAISTLMIFVNEIAKFDSISRDVYERFLRLLAPFAPHITEELWKNIHLPQTPSEGRGRTGAKSLSFGEGSVEVKSIHLSECPKCDPNLIKDEEAKIVIQVNGKVRAEIMVKTDEDEETIKHQVLNSGIVSKYTVGKDLKKMIYVKHRLINIVI